MLKDKIKEYLILEFEDEVSVGRVKDIAQDIADICEKENAELKQQLSSMPDKDNEIIGGE